MSSTGPKAMSVFSLQAMRRHWSLIPIVAITGAACVMCGAYVSYIALTKPDLSYSPRNYASKPPYEKIGPTEVRKLVNLHHGKIQVDPEILQLRREIGSYQA